MTDGLTQFGVRPGDVIHVRSSSPYGWAIRKALPGSWGNHDGNVVWNGEWMIAEALLGPGYVLTPWDEYRERINAGKTSVAFFRPQVMGCEISEIESLRVMMLACDLALKKPAYDWRAIVSIALNLALKTSVDRGREWEWYCTEVVALLFRMVNAVWDVWGEKNPTTYTTEKRHQSGRLKLVATVGVKPYGIGVT